MAIELSTLAFSNKADIVPQSGTVEFINTGIANTLGGNDSITGVDMGGGNGIFNDGSPETGAVIKTGAGNDTITGTGNFAGITNFGTLDTGTGNDTIIAQGSLGPGIYNSGTGIIDTGAGNDSITAIGGLAGYSGIIDMGDGNDRLTGIVTGGFFAGIDNRSTINMGNGNDMITGNGGFAGIFNGDNGTTKTGAGNDSNIGSAGQNGIALFSGKIDMGNGNDILVGSGGTSGIWIFSGATIDMGAGNDNVDASIGGFNGDGGVNMGSGNDVLKGFGSGNFDGGKGNNMLTLLTPGSYTIGVCGATVSFTSHGITMNTSAFETLIAGATAYSFSSLTNGQTVSIA